MEISKNGRATMEYRFCMDEDMAMTRGKLAIVSFGLGLLAVLAACSSDHYGASSSGKDVSPKELELDYDAFDQKLGQGWRGLADKGKYREAAELIDDYETKKKGLEEWQRVNLRFHAGQLYAFANEKETAIARFNAALLPKEPLNSPVKWNTYVKATIAFLEKDRKKLAECREEIAKGPKIEDKTPNLDIVDRFLKYFDEPYSAVY